MNTLERISTRPADEVGSAASAVPLAELERS